MNGLRHAIGFLTILPLAPSSTSTTESTSAGMVSARGWFPVVGLLLGIVLAAIDIASVLMFGADFRIGWASSADLDFYASFSSTRFLWTVLIVVALVALTRALHLDGFMDSCDALLGGFDRERRLAILHDPHVGAFAVVGVVCLLLVKVAALGGLHATNYDRLPVLLLFPCLSRWAMLLTMELYPYARRNGLGTAFFHESNDANGDGMRRIRWHLIFAFVFTLVVSVALAGIVGIMLLAAACAVAWAIGAWATRLLGGVTGDTYGAVNEVAEVVVITLALLISAASSFGIHSPLLDQIWQAVG